MLFTMGFSERFPTYEVLSRTDRQQLLIMAGSREAFRESAYMHTSPRAGHLGYYPMTIVNFMNCNATT